MATFIPYVSKPQNATIRKSNKLVFKNLNSQDYSRIESSDVLVEMLPAPRGATSEKDWQGTAASESIAQGTQADSISAKEGLGAKSNICSQESKASSGHAEGYANIGDVIDNDKALCVSKRQRYDSPLPDEIPSHYDKKRQRRDEKDDGAFSIHVDGDICSTARTTPVLELDHLTESSVFPEVINDDQEWEVRRIIGKEVIDGETNYLVDWNPTLLPAHLLGHAKELVGKFEDRLRAQREAKNGPRGAGLKRKGRGATRNADGQHKKPGRQPRKEE
ncbi:hypothetical protein HYALB_00013544 [Hymenoscyphus albidus]|uniref:Chromo domain-containing protein n=1 Tax=Hymenoscyphus albidus TaxID=595503 RepID=A0A9N9QAJ4_9HELO|nr:hypothetical protein HYALB_00013544 [Hymenoscyphus albidus]